MAGKEKDIVMSLLTPLGKIRVFIDGNPVTYTIDRIKADADETVDDEYRITVFVTPDGHEHTVACGLEADQEIDSAAKFAGMGFCYALCSKDKKISLAINSAVTRVNDFEEQDELADIAGRGCELSFERTDEFYYQLVDMYPIAVANRIIFGIAWKSNCATEFEPAVNFASEKALYGESTETAVMPD